MRWLAVLFLLLLAGCFRAPEPPGIDLKGGPSIDDAGTFLVQIGYWLIAAGSFACALTALIWRVAGTAAGQTVLVSAAGAIATGLALVFIGPWLAIIFISCVILALAAVVYIAIRNRSRIINKIEEVTGLEVDGE